MNNLPRITIKSSQYRGYADIYYLTAAVATSSTKMSPRKVVERAISIHNVLSRVLDRQVDIENERSIRKNKIENAINDALKKDKMVVSAKKVYDDMAEKNNVLYYSSKADVKEKQASTLNRLAAKEKLEKITQKRIDFYRKKFEKSIK